MVFFLPHYFLSVAALLSISLINVRCGGECLRNHSNTFLRDFLFATVFIRLSQTKPQYRDS